MCMRAVYVLRYVFIWLAELFRILWSHPDEIHGRCGEIQMNEICSNSVSVGKLFAVAEKKNNSNYENKMNID